MFARARMAGAGGTVSGVASAVPELLVAIENAIGAGEHDRVEILDRRVHQFIEQIARFPLPVGIKEAVRQRKMNAGVDAVPLGDQEKLQMDQFISWFGPWLEAVLKECDSKSKKGSTSGL